MRHEDMHSHCSLYTTYGIVAIVPEYVEYVFVHPFFT